MDARLVTMQDAARECGVSRGRIYDLAKSGALPGVVRLGRRQLRVDREKLEAFIAAGGVRMGEAVTP